MSGGGKRGSRDAAVRVLRMLLGATFLYAASEKMRAPQEWADALATFHLVPDSMINPLALGLPLFELVCGLSLLTGVLRTMGLLGTIGLLALFLAALGIAMARGLPIQCGCFGANAPWESQAWVAAARDAVLLAGALTLYRYDLGSVSQERACDAGRASEFHAHFHGVSGAAGPGRSPEGPSKKVASRKLV